jgi:choline dehydrogenase-like flavoprotein
VIASAATTAGRPDQPFDVCIVGSGPAGITVARSLPKSLSIALVEAGGFDYEADSQKSYEGDTVGLPPDYLSTTRSRLFGGSSFCWGGVCRPLDAYDLERKDWLPASIAWPFGREELLPYYDRASQLLGLQSFFADGRDRRALTRDGAHSEGLVLVPFQHSDPTMRFGTEFRDELVRAENITLFLHANAMAFDSAAGGDVRALEVVDKAGQRSRIAARYFVLATGGIENARILLNSTNATPAGLGNRHDQLGRYFMSHTPIWGAGQIVFADSPARDMEGRLRATKGRICLSLDDDIKRRERLLNLGLALQYGRRQRLYRGERQVARLREQLLKLGIGLNLGAGDGGNNDFVERAVAGFAKSTGQGEAALFSFFALPEAVPDPDNRVTLSSRSDDNGIRRVNVRFQTSEQEAQNLERSLALIANRLGGQALGRVRIEFNAHDPATRVADQHHMGTTRMHDDPRRGVVDRNCIVHGTRNLYVAGSSVFPSAGFVNPTFTIIALAHRIADHLARSAQSQGGVKHG